MNASLIAVPVNREYLGYYLPTRYLAQRLRPEVLHMTLFSVKLCRDR